MRIRMTVLIENDKHLGDTKEKIEETAKKGWQQIFDQLSNGVIYEDKATVENCELIEM